ncbi:MAG: alpha/beta hydrolase [Pseudomonadota bacterium]|nr:alpha/beta hydrolase [Pseudomonadota bacterium]
MPSDSSGGLPPQACRYERLEGIRIRLAECGEGVRVVLLPGWPQSIHAWRKVIPLLAPHCRVIAIDPPGLGDSDPLPTGSDTRAVAASIKALLDRLGYQRILLVGHDIGAWIGYAFAAAYPESVRRLVAIDAAVPGVAPAGTLALTPDRVRKAWHFFFNALPDLPEALIAGRERLYLEWLFRNRSADPDAAFSDADVETYARCYSRPGRMRAGFDYYRAIFDSIAQNQGYARTKLRMPVLAIGGGEWLGAGMQATFEPIAENVSGVVIEGCGHFVPEEAPERLVELLLEFFAAELGGREGRTR